MTLSRRRQTRTHLKIYVCGDKCYGEKSGRMRGQEIPGVVVYAILHRVTREGFF